MGRPAGSTERVLLGLVVAAVHLVVVMAALTATWHRRVIEADSRALTLIRIESPRRALPDISPAQAVPDPNLRAPRIGEASEPMTPALEESAATTDSSAIPDWRGSLEAAATASVAKAIRDESYRPFGPIERPSAGSSSAPTIFESPKHKLGDIDHDAVQGRTLIWHSENCFTELKFPTLKDPNVPEDGPNPPKCMWPIGELKPRGDLFESIKKR